MSNRFGFSQYADVNPPKRPKSDLSRSLADDVEEWLKRGNQIEQLDIRVNGEFPSLFHPHAPGMTKEMSLVKERRSRMRGSRNGNTVKKQEARGK